MFSLNNEKPCYRDSNVSTKTHQPFLTKTILKDFICIRDQKQIELLTNTDWNVSIGVRRQRNKVFRIRRLRISIDFSRNKQSGTARRYNRRICVDQWETHDRPAVRNLRHASRGAILDFARSLWESTTEINFAERVRAQFWCVLGSKHNKIGLVGTC